MDAADLAPCRASGDYTLRPLSHAQLVEIAACRVPADLGVGIADEALPPHFVAQAALDRRAEGLTPDLPDLPNLPAPPAWRAVYLIVRTRDRTAVGSCCFQGEPCPGRVEIGYGVAPGCRRAGAASAAVTALLTLALDGGASEVLADVSPGNEASMGLLARLRFARIGTREDPEDGTLVQWLARL